MEVKLWQTIIRMGGGQNTYNPLKTKGKNKKIITIIIFLILIVVSISFAVFSPSINLLGRRNIKISKCELDINFKESDELMLVSKYPISKEEALKYDAKDITITNNSTCDTAYFKLTIKDLSNSSINKDKINYQLIDKSNNNEIADKNPDNFLVQDSLTKGNSKSYSIRIWIDERATNSDLYINGDTTKPIEYKYALNIETSDEEIKSKAMTASEFALANVGTNGLEEVKESDTVTSYRYRGKDINNYVTFNNETWRIIGIIPVEDSNKVTATRYKLIRSEDLGSTNVEKTSELCNSTYSSMSQTTKNMINDILYTDITGSFWVNPKVGLMRSNDYYYSSSKQCTQELNNFTDDTINCITNNWLFFGKDVCTMELSDTGAILFDAILSNGRKALLTPEFSETCYVYPAVYLSSNVKISSGSGTSSDPYQLQLD